MISLPKPPARGEDILVWARGIHTAVRALLPQDSRDVLPQSTSSGTSYLLKRQSQPIPPTARGPFAVYPSTIERDTDGTVTAIKVTVLDQSWIMGSVKWDDSVGVTGLGEEFELAADDKGVWLKTEVNEDREITAVTVGHGDPADDDWDIFPEAVKYDFPDAADRKQTHWFQLLAYLDPAPDDGPPTREGERLPFPDDPQLLVQCTFTHLRACEMCDERDGLIIKTLVPWHAPYIPTDPGP